MRLAARAHLAGLAHRHVAYGPGAPSAVELVSPSPALPPTLDLHRLEQAVARMAERLEALLQRPPAPPCHAAADLSALLRQGDAVLAAVVALGARSMPAPSPCHATPVALEPLEAGLSELAQYVRTLQPPAPAPPCAAEAGLAASLRRGDELMAAVQALAQREGPPPPVCHAVPQDLAPMQTALQAVTERLAAHAERMQQIEEQGARLEAQIAEGLTLAHEQARAVASAVATLREVQATVTAVPTPPPPPRSWWRWLFAWLRRR